MLCPYFDVVRISLYYLSIHILFLFILLSFTLIHVSMSLAVSHGGSFLVPSIFLFSIPNFWPSSISNKHQRTTYYLSSSFSRSLSLLILSLSLLLLLSLFPFGIVHLSRSWANERNSFVHKLSLFSPSLLFYLQLVLIEFSYSYGLFYRVFALIRSSYFSAGIHHLSFCNHSHMHVTIDILLLYIFSPFYHSRKRLPIMQRSDWSTAQKRQRWTIRISHALDLDFFPLCLNARCIGA